MRLSHSVKHAMMACDADLRFSHNQPMKLSEITPDWIAARRENLKIADVDIYTACGIGQTHFSKSMAGKRNFTIAERERILEYLTGKEATAAVPLVADALTMFPNLKEGDQRLVLGIIQSLVARSQAEPASDQPQERGLDAGVSG